MDFYVVYAFVRTLFGTQVGFVCLYKIGRTGDLNKRLSTYGTGTVDGVELLFKYRTDNHKAVEGCVKAWLKEHQLRKYKEVYQANMIKSLIKGCDGLGQSLGLKKEFVSSKAPKMAGGYYLVIAKDSVYDPVILRNGNEKNGKKLE